QLRPDTQADLDHLHRQPRGRLARIHATRQEAARLFATPKVKPKPEKKPAAAAPPTRVLPMQLRIGDRVSDGRTWWQVIGQPNMTARGKTCHGLVESVKQRGVTDIRSWGARQRVEVERKRRAMRWVHEYNGWRFGLIASEQDGRWTARIEVYEPRRASREQSPVSLPFDTRSSRPD